MVDFKKLSDKMKTRREAGCLIERRDPDYFDPPHGGRPPSDGAVTAATSRYIEQEKSASKEKVK